MPSVQPKKEQSVWPRLTLRRADQVVVATLIGVSLATIAGWCAWQGQLRGRLIDIEQAEPIAIDFKIDVNAAEWPELALLPNIGEQLAKRIIAERTERGPFRTAEELRRVRGIGPKTLESMRPFLLPLPAVGATAINESVHHETGAQPPARVN